MLDLMASDQHQAEAPAFSTPGGQGGRGCPELRFRPVEKPVAMRVALARFFAWGGQAPVDAAIVTLVATGTMRWLLMPAHAPLANHRTGKGLAQGALIPDPMVAWALSSQNVSAGEPPGTCAFDRDAPDGTGLRVFRFHSGA